MYFCLFLQYTIESNHYNLFMHPRPPGRHKGIDGKPLILSFELKFFVCRHVSMWGFQNRVCLSVCLSVRPSVCPHPEKRNPLSFVNISPTLVINTSMERSSLVLHHGNPKIWFFFQKSSKFEFWLLTNSWNHLSFVNISPTLVINTSMERSSLVLHHGNPKIWFFFQKSSKFEFWLLTNSWNHLSFVNISPTLVINTSMERSSLVLHHGNPKIWFFFQKSSKFEFWLLMNSWNPLSFVNISPTLVIDTSMERSSRVLHHGNPEMWKFFRKFELTKLNSVRTPSFRMPRK